MKSTEVQIKVSEVNKECLSQSLKSLWDPRCMVCTGPLTENYFSYFSTKTYVVGTQKNRLDERVLLSTQNTCLN